MKAGSSRKDCLAAFLVRCDVPVVGDLVCCCDDGCAVGADGCMMSGAPGSRPLAARTGSAGQASCAPMKTVSEVSLMAVLFIGSLLSERRRRQLSLSTPRRRPHSWEHLALT